MAGEAAQAAADASWWDKRIWVPAALATASLAWNMANTALTLWMGRRNRRRDAAATVFDADVRTPLNSMFGEIERIALSLRTAEQKQTVNEVKKEVDRINRDEYIPFWDRLDIALAAADGHARFASALHFQSTASTCNDAICNAFNLGPGDTANLAKLHAKVSAIERELVALRNAIRQEIERAAQVIC